MTFDLGFIKAISSGPTPPVNGEMLWYDTNVHLHKYYDIGSVSWVALASGASSWSVVLSSGAATLGQKPIISPGDGLLFEDGGFQILLETSTLSSNHTIQFQNASGTLAFLSDISGAGDLHSTLGLGNSTGGIDIELTSGDKIKSNLGSAYIDLRDGSNGAVLLYGGSRAKVFSPTQVSLESTVLLTMKTTAGQTNSITDTGFGFNIGSPSSRVHLAVTQNAWDITNTEVFKITNSQNELHFGICNSFSGPSNYIQAFITTPGLSSWLSIQPKKGDCVGIGMNGRNPQLADNQILLGVGDSAEPYGSYTDHIIGIYTAPNKGAYYNTYISSVITTRIGQNNTYDAVIESCWVGRNILFRSTQTSTPETVARIRGNELSFEITRELTYGDDNYVPTPGPHPGGILSALQVNGCVVAALTYSTPGTFIGIAGYYQGRILTLLNTTAHDITLDNNNATAGNGKLLIPSGTMILGKNESVTFYYRQNALGLRSGAWVAISSFN